MVNYKRESAHNIYMPDPIPKIKETEVDHLPDFIRRFAILMEIRKWQAEFKDDAKVAQFLAAMEQRYMDKIHTRIDEIYP